VAEVFGPEERFQNVFKMDKYRERISQMAVVATNALVIDFDDLLASDAALADNLMANPDELLPHANRAALSQLRIEDPEYAEKIGDVRTRFRHFPETRPLRSVGADDIGGLIQIEGILVRATSVKPLLVNAAFKCRRCDTIVKVSQAGIFVQRPMECTNPSCGKGPLDFQESESDFINSQEIRIQERPEDLPPGQLPRAVDIKLVEDLVDVARPGDRISVSGVVRALQEAIRGRGRLRTFDLYIEANNVEVSGKEPEIVQITPEEERQILELAQDPFIHRKIIQSIASSIYGYDDLKESIMYLLFSGVPLTLPDGITIRGDINVLLIGDPGTAKSQLLQYVAKIAPRGLYTSGRGSTAAGLTAAVMRDITGGMTLEAGALVLADKGVCAIDEIDKMRPEDRVAIHEAMEQQTVSVAKGGIIATLNARSSILAAANPALGRYDPYRTVTENINLPVTVLSRFDLIFVIRDEPAADVDTRMAEHILSLHKTGVTPEEPPIQPHILRKYISYAKTVKPILSEDALKRLQEFYLQMRSISETSGSPVAITPRQLEALVRLSEARARVALHQNVEAIDAEAVIRLMRKSLEQVGIDIASGKYDIDIIMTGKPKSLRDRLQAVLTSLVDMEKETGMVNAEALYARLQRDFEIDRAEAGRLVSQLTREGTIYSPRPGFLKKT